MPQQSPKRLPLTGTWQQYSWILIGCSLTVFILVQLKFILVPLAFAGLLSFLLAPIAGRIELVVKSRILSIFLTFLFLLIVLGVIFGVLSWQMMEVVEDLPDISTRLKSGTSRIFTWMNENLDLSREESRTWLEENLSGLVDKPLDFVQSSISSSTSFLFDLFFCVLALFFFLWYRTSLRNFLVSLYKVPNRTEIRSLLKEIEEAIQGYLKGVLLVMAILAILNSLGLWIIGVDYPVFWGVLGGILAIVPYIGTFIGGVLPTVYALATPDQWWQPIAVIILYASIQFVDGNFITPRIIGGSVRINPFAAILLLLAGGAIWGIAGIILALPIGAAYRQILLHSDNGKAIGLLMTDDLHKREHDFWDVEESAEEEIAHGGDEPPYEQEPDKD